MTSKAEYLPSRHKIYAASQQERSSNTLRSLRDTSKVHTNKPLSVPSTCRKNGKGCNLKSVNIKRLTTSRSTSVSDSSWRKKITKEGTLRKSSNKKVNASGQLFDEDVDLTSISDMEAEAFQLATFVESSDALDDIFNDIQNDNPKQHPTLPSCNTGDPPKTASLREMKLDQLLDLTIKELQKSTNANTQPVDAVQSNITLNQMNSVRSIAVCNIVTTKRNNEDSDKKKRTNCHGNVQVNATDRSDRIHVSTGNSLKRRRNTLSAEPSILGVPTELRTKAVGNDVLHKNICKERGSSTSSTLNTTPNSLVTTHDVRLQLSKSSSNNVFRQTPYTTITKTVALKQQMIHLFNRTCYHYLNDRPCRSQLCKWNHSLPPAQQIYHKLMRLSDDTVKYTYFNFVKRSTIAFNTYFPIMSEVFGKRKMESILLREIGDCEKRENIPFLMHIFNGLIMAGSSKRDALTLMANNCSNNRDCYDVFLEIIIDTDALYFIDLLKKYHLYGTISTQSVYKLLQQVIEASGTALLPVFIDILDKYSMYGGFDAETFRVIIPRVHELVKENLSMSQRLDHIEKRMK